MGRIIYHLQLILMGDAPYFLHITDVSIYMDRHDGAGAVRNQAFYLLDIHRICNRIDVTKVFNSIEGGAVCFRDSHLGSALYELKNFGIHGPEEVSAVGANAKMNEA